MRIYPENNDDIEELKELNAEQWQIECLRLNPFYTGWGNYEDYMSDTGGGDLSNPFATETVKEGLIELNDYNECVNFYFDLYRPGHECEACGGTGLNPETRELSDTFFGSVKKDWCEELTEIEVDALWDSGKLQFEWSEKPTPEQVNKKAKESIFFHDTITKWICVKARAKHLGIYGDCGYCDGRGFVYTQPKAKLGLQLWILHPRKGCSRGIYIKEIHQEELPKVFEWLTEAAARNANRFWAVVEKGKNQ